METLHDASVSLHSFRPIRSLKLEAVESRPEPGPAGTNSPSSDIDFRLKQLHNRRLFLQKTQNFKNKSEKSRRGNTEESEWAPWKTMSQPVISISHIFQLLFLKRNRSLRIETCCSFHGNVLILTVNTSRTSWILKQNVLKCQTMNLKIRKCLKTLIIHSLKKDVDWSKFNII